MEKTVDERLANHLKESIAKVEAKNAAIAEKSNKVSAMKDAMNPITEQPIILQGDKFMNPLKWAVWIRIAVVVSFLWLGGTYTDNYLRGRAYNFWMVLLTILLFWGGAWIVHGIRMWHIQKKGKR